MENLDPTPPHQIKDGKWRVLALHAASSLIWGGGFDGGLLFHFILSKIVAIDLESRYCTVINLL